MRQAFGGVLGRDDAAAFFQADFDHAGSGRKLGTLVELSSGNIVGFSGLMQCHALAADDYELGFVLARPAWGKGYATEIGRGQLQYGFGTLKCTRLLALAAPTNLPSISALRKIGMHYHSTMQMEGRGERQIYLVGSEDARHD